MREGSAAEVFIAFLRLGCTAFGGPVAHLGWFRQEFVVRRRWLEDAAYAELVALCQMLPGPTSSQTGFALGLRRAGPLGGAAAFLGFTLPSAALMTAAGAGAAHLPGGVPAGLLWGLNAAAAAVVAQALLQMTRQLAPDGPRRILALLATAACLALAAPWVPVACIGVGAALGPLLPGALPAAAAGPGPGGAFERDARFHQSARLHRPAAFACAALAALVLGASLWAPARIPWGLAPFAEAGSLVFGGGHVVLPLLEGRLVPAGQVSADQFMAGYGLVQAVPGPLFTFAAFLGAVRSVPPAGVTGALLATAAIFLPGLLLVAAALPWWERLRRWRLVRHAVRGANAAVVGILAAALIAPIGTDLVANPLAAGLAVLALASLLLLRPPVVPLVACCAAAGWLLL